ncbi:MAG: cell division protein FtsZ [Candidatus Sumerlaeaceae bacterium]|nr:cell division protein FtsZ [Candidatus Sumerlaeaceae bacterium]
MEIQFERDHRIGAQIKVIGIGGAGSNAVDELIASGLKGVDFYVMNTDVQALGRSICPNKIQIGRELTGGRGAGSNPDIGRKAAEDAAEEIRKIIEGADMIFITAGLGGGTGTGAAPVVAQLARDLGILTIAVVVYPFEFEGKVRARNAEQGLRELRECVDACTVVHNQRLLMLDEKMPVKEAFQRANEVLTTAVTSVAELISLPGEINVEFSDIKTIMQQKGGAVIGFGIGRGDKRALEAVEKARDNKLLKGLDLKGASGVLICFKGGTDLQLREVADACEIIQKEAHPEANIIFGMVLDEEMKDEVRVTIIATGIERELGETSSTSARNSAGFFSSPSSPARNKPVSPTAVPVEPKPAPTPTSSSLGQAPKASEPVRASEPRANEPIDIAMNLKFVEEESVRQESPQQTQKSEKGQPEPLRPDDPDYPAIYRKRLGL